MKAALAFFRSWLGLVHLLVYFVIPFYLIAIYPEVPEPALRFMRGSNYGVVAAPASEIAFWYRFLACGGWVLLGVLLCSYKIRKLGQETAEREKRREERRQERRARRHRGRAA